MSSAAPLNEVTLTSMHTLNIASLVVLWLWVAGLTKVHRHNGCCLPPDGSHRVAAPPSITTLS